MSIKSKARFDMVCKQSPGVDFLRVQSKDTGYGAANLKDIELLIVSDRYVKFSINLLDTITSGQISQNMAGGEASGVLVFKYRNQLLFGTIDWFYLQLSGGRYFMHCRMSWMHDHSADRRWDFIENGF